MLLDNSEKPSRLLLTTMPSASQYWPASWLSALRCWARYYFELIGFRSQVLQPVTAILLSQWVVILPVAAARQGYREGRRLSVSNSSWPATDCHRQITKYTVITLGRQSLATSTIQWGFVNSQLSADNTGFILLNTSLNNTRGYRYWPSVTASASSYFFNINTIINGMIQSISFHNDSHTASLHWLPLGTHRFHNIGYFTKPARVIGGWPAFRIKALPDNTMPQSIHASRKLNE